MTVLTSVIVAGGVGAVAGYFSSTLDHLLQEIMVTQPLQPLAALKSILPAVAAIFGFFFGTLVLLIWHFLKARVVRFLLGYNGWFLHPKRPINKLWYLLMIAFVGRKNRGCGKYQDYLPALPVPSLKKTCRKYLDSVRPLLTPEEYSETESAVKEFQKKDGKKLQRILILRSWRMRNWLAEWWDNFIYLRQRTPIPFNSNYYAMDRAALITPHQLDRAAMLLYSSVMFALELRQAKIDSPMANNIAPFCMNGYKFLHMTTRIPGEDIDKSVLYASEKPRHAVIYRQGKLFHVEVMSPGGRVLPPQGIKQQLERVVEMAGDELDTTGVGTFTALPRAEWAKIRKRMEQSPVNQQSFHSIDSSIAFMCLDTEELDHEDLTAQARLLFHGNPYNRWWDKCIQLIVSGSATTGANVEHAILDATVASQQWEYMLTDEEYDENGHVLDPFHGKKVFEVPPPTELKWELDGFQDDLTRAKQNVTELIHDSDLVLTHPDYGKAVPKKCKLSPDGWFQMAMQLAYYRTYKRCVLTYESSTTRLYYKGRTETIRPVSDASVEFVKAMDDPSVPRDDVKKLLKKAIEYQCQYKMEAMRGMGVDRHLLGLYIVAQGLEMDPLPRIFRDKAFNMSFLLSTSQTPVATTKRFRLKDSTIGGGFGTVTEEGYGVSYIVAGEDKVNFSIHSKRSCPTTDSEKFGNEITRAMNDMKNLYEV